MRSPGTSSYSSEKTFRDWKKSVASWIRISRSPVRSVVPSVVQTSPTVCAGPSLPEALRYLSTEARRVGL